MRKLGCALMMLGALASAQERGRPNLLLVTVDALRADRVSQRLTPTLARLAAGGMRFDRAYAHTPLTLPSHASILTGLVPPAHGARNNGFRLDDTVTTLAELLLDAGYRTGAFVGSSALDARFGLGQGFAEYDDRFDARPAAGAAGPVLRHGSRPGAAVLAAASAWIARQPEPWFAWAHVRDPHAPYASYEAAVAAADAALDHFLATGPLPGLLGRTLIVITADHGESLGEHGERTHGVFAYEPAIRVPLILAGPGVSPPPASGASAAHAAIAAHVDIAPTVLDLLGVGGRAFDGRSLTPAFTGAPLLEAWIYFEALEAALMRGGAPLTGMIAGRWKYIDLPLPELYDLDADPGEEKNLAEDDPVRVRRMRDETVKARTRAARADPATTLAEAEARARLRSLGYVGSASWRLGATRLEDDPKRLLPLHLAYERAVEAAASNPAAAAAQLRAILSERPDFAAAVDALGGLLLAGGDSKQAVRLLSDALAGGLRHRVLAERLAAAYLANKDPRAAVALLTPLVEADGAAVNARFLLARALVATGDPISAAAQLEAALRLDPTFPAASQLLARLRR